jgi:outer membrane protein OmpA-like peptidoglycan-associated protein
MLEQLRAGQDSELNFTPLAQELVFEQIGTDMAGHKLGGPRLSIRGGKAVYTCQLHRVGTTDVAFPVLLNDQPVELPALHARCAFDDGEEVNSYILDQLDNPIGLATTSDPVSVKAQLIKIVLPEEPEAAEPKAKRPLQGAGGGGGAGSGAGGGGGGGGSAMEKALADKKPVEVYGIYFDFNSSTIRPQSEPVLKQIAAIMQRNPDWVLSVGGHTDNIGGDEFNLGLSQRRAAAVKDALVTRYKITPDRLVTSGYGLSRPIATNQTMEGRARNRRVELQRQ